MLFRPRIVALQLRTFSVPLCPGHTARFAFVSLLKLKNTRKRVFLTLVNNGVLQRKFYGYRRSDAEFAFYSYISAV